MERKTEMKHKEKAFKVEKKRKVRYKDMRRFYHDVIFKSQSRGNILSWAGIHHAQPSKFSLLTEFFLENRQ